jgi:hypothetical protein
MGVNAPSDHEPYIPQGERVFDSPGHGKVQASKIELRYPDEKEGTLGWLARFQLNCCGETAKTWPTIHANYVNGIVDTQGNWIADFPEPTRDNPTNL